MAKEGEELWDDSALITAFDKAVSNYKRMQKKKKLAGSSEGNAEYANGANRVCQILEDESVAYIMDASHPGTVVNGIIMSNSGLEDNGYYLVHETNCIETHAPELQSNAHGIISTQDELQEYVGPSMDDYTKLYNDYYKIEEKKQQILLQLQQFSSGVQPASLPSQELQVFGEQASHSTTACSSCSYVSHCVVLPCTMIPCSLAGKSICKMCGITSEQLDYKKLSPLDDTDIVHEAMVAAGRAISSMKLAENGENKPRKEKISPGKMEIAGTSETDLSAVLNAWYSAGFCTGKSFRNEVVQAEAGLTEVWDHNHEQLRCAGVTLTPFSLVAFSYPPSPTPLSSSTSSKVGERRRL